MSWYLAPGHVSRGHLGYWRMGVLVDRRDDAFDRRTSAVRAPALVDVGLELLAVLVDVARDRVDGEVAEGAERLPEHAVAHVPQQVEVGVLAAARLDLLQQAHHPARALPARRALAAGLVHVELLDPQGELHHASALVDDDDRR